MKKSNLLLILLLILLLSSCKKTKVVEEFDLTLRLKPSEMVNYEIELNNSIIKSGTLESSWNDITIKNKVGTYKIFFWNKNHYIESIELKNLVSNKDHIITKGLTFTHKKGNISASLTNSLVTGQKGRTSIVFAAKDTVKYISYCIYRSIGVISSKPSQDVSICDTQSWTNSTKYGNLSNNQFFCEGIINKCSSIRGKLCNNEPLPIPSDVIADNCYFLGKTLTNNNHSITIDYETMNYYDESDNLLITILDMEFSKQRIFGNRKYEFRKIGEWELR